MQHTPVYDFKKSALKNYYKKTTGTARVISLAESFEWKTEQVKREIEKTVKRSAELVSQIVLANPLNPFWKQFQEDQLKTFPEILCAGKVTECSKKR